MITVGKKDNRYSNIQTEEKYNTLLLSGMFWEFHPELTGDWKKDKEIIKNNNYEKQD